jgi:hypothetical protein
MRILLNTTRSAGRMKSLVPILQSQNVRIVRSSFKLTVSLLAGSGLLDATTAVSFSLTEDSPVNSWRSQFTGGRGVNAAAFFE